MYYFSKWLNFELLLRKKNFQIMDTYQSNTRESFTDEEEDTVGHPSLQMPVTTNTSTTSSIESVEAVFQKSLHKVVSEIISRHR